VFGVGGIQPESLEGRVLTPGEREGDGKCLLTNLQLGKLPDFVLEIVVMRNRAAMENRGGKNVQSNFAEMVKRK